MFAGKPVYIEFTAEGQVFSVMTEIWYKKEPPLDRYASGMPDPFVRYLDYDVDYCDSHLHYHVSEAGSGPGHFPLLMNNRVDEQSQPVPYKYWIAPHLEVDFSQCRAPECCIAITEADLIPLILTDEDDLQAFLAEYPQPTVSDLITYWDEETHDVEEGQVVYCSICKRSYDYEAWVPCPHIRWCDTCGEWSVPDGDCEHRSEDDTRYVNPEEDAESVR